MQCNASIKIVLAETTVLTMKIFLFFSTHSLLERKTILKQWNTFFRFAKDSSFERVTIDLIRNSNELPIYFQLSRIMRIE